MILIKYLYAFILYVSDSDLQCNKHNSYLYRVQYQDIQTALGSWYGPVAKARSISFPTVRTTTQGQSVYVMLRSISVTIVFIALKTRIWHIQYKCIDIFIRIIEGFHRRYHLRYYLIWIDYSNCLNGVQLIMRNKMRL